MKYSFFEKQLNFISLLIKNERLLIVRRHHDALVSQSHVRQCIVQVISDYTWLIRALIGDYIVLDRGLFIPLFPLYVPRLYVTSGHKQRELS